MMCARTIMVGVLSLGFVGQPLLASAQVSSGGEQTATGAGNVAATVASDVTGGRGGKPTRQDYMFLETVPDQMDACASGSASTDDSDDPQKVIAGIKDNIACLRKLANELGERFYPPGALDMTGKNQGIGNTLDVLESTMQPFFEALQTKALACTPKCDPIYSVQAYDMRLRLLSSLILDITERLKDDSPIQTEDVPPNEDEKSPGADQPE